MTEEIISIRRAVDDLRDSAAEIDCALDVVAEDGNRLMAKVSRLKTENERLKALVLDMYRTIRGPYADRRPLEAYRYKGRMRALGIKVD